MAELDVRPGGAAFIVMRGPDGKDLKLTTQARVNMQEPLLFSPNG